MALPRFTFTSRARPFLEVGIGDPRVQAPAARWDVSHWDTPGDTWSGVEPEWQDVTCQAYVASIVAGRDRTADRFAVGTMTVTARNVTGWADLVPPDPDDWNTLQLRPGRSIRFGVDHVEAGRLVLFRGYVDSVRPSYDPEDLDTVTLDCIDALGEVGRVRLLDDADPSHSGEYVTARLGRILDAAQWPPAKRQLVGSSIALLPVALDGQAADLLGITADSAGGSIFGDTNGAIRYRAIDWQMWHGDPDATIGNVEPDDVCPTHWERPFAREDISNLVTLANRREPDPDRVLASDPASWGLYGVEPFERSDLDTQDVDKLQLLADRYLETRGAATIPRVRTVSLDGRTGDDVVDLLSTASPFRPSRYRCRLQLARGLVFDGEYLVTGVRHDVGPDTWDTEITLDVAEPYRMPGSARWEPADEPDTGLSRWDRILWN